MSESIRIDADLTVVAEVGVWLRRYIAETGLSLPDEVVATFDLALHELVVNAIVHGSALDYVDIRASIEGRQLVVDVIDEGEETFDPDAVAVPEPGVAQIGGYGLMIIQQVASSVGYRRHDGLNHWIVTFPLASGAEPGGR